MPVTDRRWLPAGAAVLLLLAGGVVVAVANPFAGSAASSDHATQTTAPTALATVVRRSLTSQTQVSGTLGYAGSWTLAVPPPASASTSPATFTMLPGAGKVIRRGQRLYAVNASPTLLLYGSTPAWRAFAPGMSAGPDVGQLNANLRVLGHGAPTGDAFTSATGLAIERLQAANGLTETGVLPLGAIAFEPAAARVTSVTPTPGQAVQPGPIVTLSSTTHDVSIPLDVSQESEVRVGDRVLVTLPDNGTTAGVVSSVGRVATAPPSSQGGSSNSGDSGTPTIEVDVQLLHPGAAGTLDEAPVSVSITTARIRSALVVPVNALVALAGGGYAVEEVAADGLHRLVPVAPGLFDDAAGAVQVTGRELDAGQRVVVPAS